MEKITSTNPNDAELMTSNFVFSGYCDLAMWIYGFKCCVAMGVFQF